MSSPVCIRRTDQTMRTELQVRCLSLGHRRCWWSSVVCSQQLTLAYCLAARSQNKNALRVSICFLASLMFLSSGHKMVPCQANSSRHVLVPTELQVW